MGLVPRLLHVLRDGCRRQLHCRSPRGPRDLGVAERPVTPAVSAETAICRPCEPALALASSDISVHTGSRARTVELPGTEGVCPHIYADDVKFGQAAGGRGLGPNDCLSAANSKKELIMDNWNERGLFQ